MTSQARILASPSLRGCIGARVVRQLMPHGCGPCAATIALRWYGLMASEGMCLAALKPRETSGVDFCTMMLYLQHRGLRACAYARFGVEAMREACAHARPVLLEWPDAQDHWVVLIGHEPEHDAFVFADPTPLGPLWVASAADIERDWLPANSAHRPAAAIVVQRWARERVHPERKRARNAHYYRFNLISDWPTRRPWPEVYRALSLQQESLPAAAGSPP